MAAAAITPRWLASAFMRFNLPSDSFMATLCHETMRAMRIRWGRRCRLPVTRLWGAGAFACQPAQLSVRAFSPRRRGDAEKTEELPRASLLMERTRVVTTSLLLLFSLRLRVSPVKRQSRLPEILHDHQVGLALIHAGIEDGFAVGRNPECRQSAEVRILDVEYYFAMLGGEIEKRNRHAVGGAIKLQVVDAVTDGLNRGGPREVVLRDDGFFLFTTRYGDAPDGAAIAKVDVLAVGRLHRLRRAKPLREMHRAAAIDRGLPDLAARRLEVNGLAVVRKGAVDGVDLHVRGFASGCGRHGVEFLAPIAGGVEDEQFAIRGPAQARQVRPVEMRHLDTVAAIGVAEPNFVIAALVGDVGDLFAVGRIAGAGFTAGGANHGMVLAGGVALAHSE